MLKISGIRLPYYVHYALLTASIVNKFSDLGSYCILIARKGPWKVIETMIFNVPQNISLSAILTCLRN